MSREHASKGYKVVTGTDEVSVAFYGISVVEATVVNAITAPTVSSIENTGYDGDEGGMAALALPVGYYPIRGSAIDLTSGKVILWKE